MPRGAATTSVTTSTRRRLIGAGLAAVLGAPAWASSRRVLQPMTEGPFYPPRAWRERWPDGDADLTRVQQRDGSVRSAAGEVLGLEAQVVDRDGRMVDGAEVEIWQCDARAQYRHPSVPQRPGEYDDGFQGFGAARADAQGWVRFRTIRPVPYPGRTPHIHVKIRHASFGELTSQLFVAGDPGNARDFLWRALTAADQATLAMQLQAAPPASDLRWLARHALVVPA